MKDTLSLDLTTPQGRLDAALHHGVMPAQMLGMDPAQMEAAYALAVADIEAGRFEAAGDRLAFLLEADPSERRYQVALALCLQELGAWEDAGRLYAHALLSNATDALCAYRIGECLGAMQATDEAREAYDAAIRLSWLHPDFEAVRLQAQQQLDVLSSGTDQGARA